MNNIYEHMQKLAFGKVVTPEAQPLNESNLKDKIKELVHASLGEAKKKKKDVAPQDDTVDVDLEMGAEEAPAEETPSDTMTPETPSDIDIDPKVKSVQDYLQKAYANAKELGDEKLMTQIGNTITMVVRNQVLGGQVAESLNENTREEVKMVIKEKRLTTSKNALELAVNKVMAPITTKVVEDANNALMEAMKQLDSQLKGKTVSVPGEWQGTIISVIPTLKNRTEGKNNLKKAEPAIKIKVTSVQNPGDYEAKVGKVINMDYYSWLNYDVELV